MGGNSAEWAATMRRRLHLNRLSDAEIQRAIVDGVVERYRTRPSPVIPGAPEAVRRIAASRPVALASSSHPAVIAAAVEPSASHGVFGAVVSSDEVAEGKPAPDVYLRAASPPRVEPGRCLVVEDSLNGVRAGKAAGRSSCSCRTQSVPPAGDARELADRVVQRLADLAIPAAIAAGRPAAARPRLRAWPSPSPRDPSTGRSASASCAFVLG